MLATCLEVLFNPGSPEYINGIRHNHKGKRIGGKYYRNLGSGKGVYRHPGTLHLLVRMKDNTFGVNITEPLRRIWPEVHEQEHFPTAEHARLLKATMPEMVSIEHPDHGAKNALSYLELMQWLGDALARQNHARWHPRMPLQTLQPTG